MVAKQGVVKAQARLNFPSFLRQRARVAVLDAWYRGKQQEIPQVAGEYLDGNPYTPRSATTEYNDLSSRSPNNFAGLVVTSLAQTAYVDGVRRPGSKDNLEVWSTWQENGWDARQIALHRDTIAHGLAFGLALPGANPLTGRRTTLMRGVSAKSMAAFYGTKAYKPGVARHKDTVALGERIYRGGIASKNVPACSGCHSPNGAGIPSQYPRLAGQHSEYTEAQLVAFRAGTRANGPMMLTIASKMSDVEIKAVSDYIAGLR